MFLQPLGKQYTFGKGPEYESEVEQLRIENRFLNQQIEIKKKYEKLEGMRNQKYL
ncbi:transposase (fragment) [Carnobacterium maltaromaticum]